MAISPGLGDVIAYHVNYKDFRGNGVILGLLAVLIGAPKLREAQNNNGQCK